MPYGVQLFLKYNIKYDQERKENMKESIAQNCLDFIGEGVSCFHAVEAAEKICKGGIHAP